MNVCVYGMYVIDVCMHVCHVTQRNVMLSMLCYVWVRVRAELARAWGDVLVHVHGL